MLRYVCRMFTRVYWLPSNVSILCIYKQKPSKHCELKPNILQAKHTPLMPMLSGNKSTMLSVIYISCAIQLILENYVRFIHKHIFIYIPYRTERLNELQAMTSGLFNFHTTPTKPEFVQMMVVAIFAVVYRCAFTISFLSCDPYVYTYTTTRMYYIPASVVVCPL